MHRSSLRPFGASLLAAAIGVAVAACAGVGTAPSGTPARSPLAAPANDPSPLPELPLHRDGAAVAPYTLRTLAVTAEPATVAGQPGVRLTWTGSPGQAALESTSAGDLRVHLDGHGALVADIVVHQPPPGRVMLRVDCRWPCHGAIDLTSFFTRAPLDAPVPLKLPLVCFETAGAKFAAVTAPLVISATKPFVLSLANVRYVPGAGQHADATSCSGA